MSEGKPARHGLKWLKRILVLLLVLVLVAFGALLTSQPQKILLTMLVGKALDANVEIEGLSALTSITMNRFKASDKKVPASEAPLCDLTGVKINYSIPTSRENIRLIDSFSVDGLALNYKEAAPAPEKAPAAAPAPAEEKKPEAPEPKKGKRDNLPFIPRDIKIGKLTADYSVPTLGAAIDGLGIQAKVESKKKFDLSLNGSGMTGGLWTSNRDAAHRFENGVVDFHGVKDGSDVNIDKLDVNLPGLLVAQGSVKSKVGGKLDVDLALSKFVAENLDLISGAGDLPIVPLRFKRIDASDTRLRFVGDLSLLKLSAADTKVNIIGEDLVIGPKDHEYYEGNLSITGGAGDSSDLQLDLEAAFNRGQKAKLSLSGALKDFVAHVGIQNWSKDDFLAVIPKDERVKYDLSGLQSLNADVDLSVKIVNLVLNAHATPTFAGADGASEQVEMTSKVVVNALDLIGLKGPFKTTSDIKLGNGTASLTGSIDKKPKKSMALTLDKLEVPRLINLATGKSFGLFDSAWSGTANLTTNNGWASKKMDLDLAVSPVKNGAVSSDSLSVKGSFECLLEKGLAGSGEIKSDKLALGPIALTGLSGALKAESNTIKLDGLSGKLSDGALTGSGEFIMDGPHKSSHVASQVKGVNLESFSAGFGLPALKLTGAADATFEIAKEDGAVKDLKVNVESAGPITVSKAILEQLLSSESFKQVTGAEQLQKAVKAFKGKDGQMPFDGVKFAIARGPERYALSLTLTSGGNPVTLDIQFDAAAISSVWGLFQQFGA
jgi:hypothetical protein